MDETPEIPNRDITPPLENKTEVNKGAPVADDLLKKNTNAPESNPPEKQPSPTGKDAEPVDIAQIVGFFEVVDTVPTAAPTRLRDQIKIYVNGGTKRLYTYDYKNDAWYYVALT